MTGERHGVVAITEARYSTLCGLPGPWLIEYRPDPIRMGENSGDERRAVYVTITASGIACYVGRTRPQTVRRGGAAAHRIVRHRREPSKRREWAAYWVLPLKDEPPDAVVDQLEVEVAARLVLPLRNRR